MGLIIIMQMIILYFFVSELKFSAYVKQLTRLRSRTRDDRHVSGQVLKGKTLPGVSADETTAGAEDQTDLRQLRTHTLTLTVRVHAYVPAL